MKEGDPDEVLAGLQSRADFTGLVAPVVVACSGGPDSLALLAIACEAGLEPIAVHVDHRLRLQSAGFRTLCFDRLFRRGAGIVRRRFGLIE